MARASVKKNHLAKRLFERAVELDSSVYSSHHYAWWLVVHPDKTFRNANRALELMNTVMEDDEESSRAPTLNTMAAVYAEKGDFSAAVRFQKQALAALKEEGKQHPHFNTWKPWFERRLKDYQSNRAWYYKDKYAAFSGKGESTDNNEDRVSRLAIPADSLSGGQYNWPGHSYGRHHEDTHLLLTEHPAILRDRF